MKKLAVFVEGYTELVFVEQLILEISGVHNIRVELQQIRGGTKVPRTIKIVKAAKPDTGQQYYVLLVDCGGDDQVKTRILEEHDNLTRKGYSTIIGMRDVRPKYSHSDIPRLEIGLRKYVKTSLIPVEFILSIMEIEAWFIAEFNHFEKIDPSITIQEIKDKLGFDPINDDLSERSNPADDLDAVYRLGGKCYEKHNTVATIKVLDYSFIYLDLQNKIGYLKRLTNVIEGFLA